MMQPQKLQPGAAFASGRYRLLTYLGGGSFGEVWRATDNELGTEVALKALLNEWLDNPVVTERFEREIRAAARLQHPGIVQILDTGYCPASGRPFYAMELVDGITLDRGPADLQVILTVYDQLMAALAYAHARGVVHRDLKPENILLTWSGASWQCKILDFGIARVEGQSHKVTAAGVVLGTPVYMSPEQAFGEASAAGPASDLYSAGVMLYELLSGRLPFTGEYMELVEAHLLKAPPKLTPRPELNAPISHELERLVLDLLEKRYFDRPESAAAVRERLKPILAQTQGMMATQRLSAVSGGMLSPFATVTTTTSQVSVMTTRGGEARGKAGGSRVKLLRLRDPVPPGRSDEKAVLWETVLKVTNDRRPGAVILTGPPGMGKGRLARWLAEMGLEHGMMRVFKVVLSEQGDLPVAMHAALYRMLHYPRLEREALRFWVDHTVALPDERDTQRLCDFLLAQLTVEATGDRAAVAERIATWSPLWWTVLAHKATSPSPKPLMVWVECSHEDLDPTVTAAWIDDILGKAGDQGVPLFVLFSVQTPADAAMLPPVAQLLLERDNVRHLHVGPLERTEQAHLARSFVPNLADSAVDTLFELAQGSPFFARELLMSWLAQGLLEPTDQGLALQVDSTRSMPERLEDLVADKLADFLRKQGEPSANALYQALMSIAFLGPTFPLPQVQMILDRLDLSASVLLRDFVIEQRRAGREPEYAFTTGLMQQVLISRARAMGQENVHKRYATEVRIVGALDIIHSGDWASAERSLAIAQRLLDERGATPFDEGRLHVLGALAFIAHRRKERDTLRRLIDLMSERADQAEDDDVSDRFVGPSELWSGLVATSAGDLIAARRHFRNARAHAIVAQHDAALLWALISLSGNAAARGDEAAARAYRADATRLIVSLPEDAPPITVRWFRIAQRTLEPSGQA